MDDVARKTLVKELCASDGLEKTREREIAVKVVELEEVGKAKDTEWKRADKVDGVTSPMGGAVRQKDESLFRRFPHLLWLT
jgi:hypothetical protein